MPNVIASGTTVVNGTLKRNNFLIGVNTSVQYGPTSATTFWNGIIPAASGYTVYAQKTVNGPSIRTAANDAELITIARQYGGTNINTISDALNYFNGQSNNLVTNIDYPSIVTSGLSFIVDAGYVPSYPRTGTTWNDISGNGYSGTLVNSPAYNSSNGGYISFVSTSSQYSTTTYTQPAYGTATSFTWNLWVNIPDSVNLNSPIIGNRGGAELIFTKLTKVAFEYYPTVLGYILPLNVWQNVCVVKSGTTLTYYRNGISVTGTTSNATTTSRPFYIGGEPTAGEYSNSNVSNIQVYNRALSSTEVLQNYNATKSRFGL
jgi:hypothetical protein